MWRMPLGAAVCLFALLITSVSGQNKWYKGNIHTHTANSDGEEILQGVVNTYLHFYYDFVFITDHNKLTKAESFSAKAPALFNGEEVTTLKAHFNALGISNVINPDGLTYQNIIDRINEQNGIAILNHPSWYQTVFSGNDVMALKNLDFIEMFNGKTDSIPANNRPNLSLWDYVLSRGRKMFAVASDDMHKKYEAGRAWIMVDSPSLQRKDILQAMRQGHFYCSNGIVIEECKLENNRITVKQRDGMAVLFIGKDGKILKRVEKKTADYELKGDEQYVRVEIYNDNRKFAFTQPIIFHDPNRSQYQLAVHAGDRQSATVGEILPQPLTVQLRDSYGRPVAGEKIIFEARPGYGFFSNGQDSIQIMTDDAGLALTTVTAGCMLGDTLTVATASVNGVQQRVRFHAKVQSGPIHNMVAVSGDQQQGLAGALLPELLQVRVTDQCAHPLSNQTVQVTVLSGTGRVNDNTAIELRTDVDGRIALSWRLGVPPGEQLLQIFSPELQQKLILRAEALRCFNHLTVMSGAGQTGPVDAILPQPLAVLVQNCFGQPAQTMVHFQVEPSGGWVGQDTVLSVVSDEKGEARTSWTLGRIAGQQRVRVTTDTDTSIVLFTALASAQEAHSIQVIQGADQIGIANQLLPMPILVAALDRYGNRVARCPILFRTVHGCVTPQEVMTDEQGLAEAIWRLGSLAGEQTLQALLVGGLSPVNITATAHRPLPATVTVLTGDAQIGVAHSLLTDSLTVMVLDSSNYPVQGCRITFNAVENRVVFFKPGLTGATVDETNNSEVELLQVVSDSTGKARVACRVGCMVGDTLAVAIAQVEGFERILHFRATIKPGPPIKLAVISGDRQQGGAGGELRQPLLVQVCDECQNPISDAHIQFTVLTGNGLVGGEKQQRLATDASGRAGVFWRLSSRPGEQKVRVQCDGLSQELELQSMALVTAQRLTLYSGDRQCGAAGSTLPTPLCVVAADSFGNPASRCPVRFRVVDGFGAFGNDSLFIAMTDENGRAEALWTLGMRAGVQRIEAALLEETAPSDKITLWLSATALPLPAAHVLVVNGAEQPGIANHFLPEAIRVQALDCWGNPVPGARIFFRTMHGVIAPPAVISDSMGMAEANWRLGPQVGLQTASIFINDLTVPVLTILANAHRSQPTSLTLVSGDKQIGVVNAVLPDTLTVVVLDSTNSPVQGYPLSFTILQGQGAFQTGNPDTTDLYGQARIVYRPTCIVGKHIVRAVLKDQEKFIDFHIMTTRESAAQRTLAPSELTPTWCQVDVTSSGTRPFVDMDWTITSAPDSLQGCYLLKTAYRDQQNPDASLLTFTVVQPVDVWLAFEQSVLTPPDWLTSGFIKTAQTVMLSPANVQYALWLKTFGAGMVALGGNAASGSSGSADNYFVMIRPRGFVAAVDMQIGEAPERYALFPNYPNPFNARTSIVFQQPVNGRVRLSVYDLYGQLIATLHDGLCPAGVHSVQFDASRQASGFYFVQMHADGFAASRRILLLK